MTEAGARLIWIEECADGDIALDNCQEISFSREREVARQDLESHDAFFCLFKMGRDLSVFKCYKEEFIEEESGEVFSPIERGNQKKRKCRGDGSEGQMGRSVSGRRACSSCVNQGRKRGGHRAYLGLQV